MEIDMLTSSFLCLRDKLHHIALRYLGSDEDAKDALQDTWLKLRDKGEFETTIEAKNKLVTVLRNVCIDHLRKAREISIDEITDVPELSDALVSKNKALKIFKSPLETHDSFERTLKRKHKFNFFEKVLCVVTFGLASKLINHLNKSNDHREAMELKNNTLAINQTLEIGRAHV